MSMQMLYHDYIILEPSLNHRLYTNYCVSLITDKGPWTKSLTIVQVLGCCCEYNKTTFMNSALLLTVNST